eukprot:9532882-Alexandrium_andersonii.AAC.1
MHGDARYMPACIRGESSEVWNEPECAVHVRAVRGPPVPNLRPRATAFYTHRALTLARFTQRP